MDSKGPNFPVTETCALLEGVRGNCASIVGGFSPWGWISDLKRKRQHLGGHNLSCQCHGVWPKEDYKTSYVAMEEPYGQGNERPY